VFTILKSLIYILDVTIRVYDNNKLESGHRHFLEQGINRQLIIVDLR